MKELDSIDPLAAALRAEAVSSLVAIDGYDGAGKTFLSDQLAALLSWPVVHLDEFVNREQGGFIEHLRFDALAPALSARPLIVEGALVLDVLVRLAIEPDCLIYVKRVSDYGFWYDDDVCDPHEPVDELLSRLTERTNQFMQFEAPAEGKSEPTPSGLSPFREEVIRYHARVRPASRAQLVFLRRVAG